MISYQTATTLLKEFSLQEEIEPLQLDEDNYCLLVSADEHVVHIRFDEELGTFIVFGSVVMAFTIHSSLSSGWMPRDSR